MWRNWFHGRGQANQDGRSAVQETAADQPAPRGGTSSPRTPPDRLFTAAVIHQAWLAIRRAGGGAGVDGVTLKMFEANLDQELTALREQLASGAYKPRPARQIFVPKNSGGLRPLTLWALRDRIAQRAVYELLAPTFEPVFLPCSYGFRVGRGVPDAIDALQKLRDQNLRWVVDADIKHCFDSIDPDRLMPLVAKRVRERLLLRYTRLWLNAKLLRGADGAPSRAGASQGSALSPLLANIYLHPFDLELTPSQPGYLRYADNFVICCRHRPDAETALELSRKGLEKRGLQLNEHKTRIVHLDQGMAWLGYFLVRNECYQL